MTEAVPAPGCRMPRQIAVSSTGEAQVTFTCPVVDDYRHDVAMSHSR